MRLQLLVLALLGSLITGCATNPVTGKSEFTFVSAAQEIAIGQQQYVPTQQMQGGQYTVDDNLTAYVKEVGDRLAAVSDRELPYEFVVVNDSAPNAWALPGGKIAINRGLLMQLENEAELAAVLGHEIVHAAARHGARSMERSMFLQGAVLLTALSAKDSDYANYIVGGAQVGAQLISQRYGRQAELEADHYGMEYMARAGYDPAAAVTLQEKFVALKNGNQPNWLEGLFASHPPSQERVEKNAENSARLRAAQAGKDWEVGQTRYDQRLAYLRSKKKAYDAFDQARALLAKKEVDIALKRVDQAIRLEPGEPRFRGLKGNLKLGEKKYKTAIRLYNDALIWDENYFEYYLGRGLSHSKLGRRDKARSDLEKSNTLLPTALATNELGNLSLQAGDIASAKRYFGEVAQSSGPLANAAKAEFIRLDLPDNPTRYFAVRPSNQDGRFYAVITNNSGLPVNDATVYFQARINGQAFETRISSGAIAAGGQKGLSPGWLIGAGDLVDNIDVRVVRVSL